MGYDYGDHDRYFCDVYTSPLHLGAFTNLIIYIMKFCLTRQQPTLNLNSFRLSFLEVTELNSLQKISFVLKSIYSKTF